MPNNIKANQVVREFFDSVGDGLTNIGNSIQDGCAQLAKDFREACTQPTFSKLFEGLISASSYSQAGRSDANQSEPANFSENIVAGETPLIEDELPPELPILNKESLKLPRLVKAYRETEESLKSSRETFKNISTQPPPSPSRQKILKADSACLVASAKKALIRAENNYVVAKKNLELEVRQLEPRILEVKRDRIENAYSKAEELEGKLSRQQVIVGKLQAETDDLSSLCEEDSWDFALNPGLRPKWEGMAREKSKTCEKEREKLTQLESEFAAARKTLDDLKDEVLILSIADEGKYEPHIYELPYSFIDDPEFELKFELSKLNSLEEQHTKMQKRVNAATQQGSRIRNIVAQTESDELLRLIKTKIDTIAQLKQSMRE